MERDQYSSLLLSLRKHSALLGRAARTAGARTGEEGRVGYAIKRRRKYVCLANKFKTICLSKSPYIELASLTLPESGSDSVHLLSFTMHWGVKNS